MLLSLMLAAGLTSAVPAPAGTEDAITLHRLRSMVQAIQATISEGGGGSEMDDRLVECDNGTKQPRHRRWPRRSSPISARAGEQGGASAIADLLTTARHELPQTQI